MTLPFIVLVLGIVFLILWYSGILRDLSSRGEDASPDRELPDSELERRLQVFERYLARGSDKLDKGDGEADS